jgi:hypothetical protein
MNGKAFDGSNLESQLKENLVRLSLDDIHELFVDQPLDIYSDNEWDYMGESVLDRIIEHMTPGFIGQKDPLRLAIVLPPEKIVPDITNRTEIAIRRWARQKIEDNHVKIRIGRRFGFRGLIPGFLFLATCVVLSKFTLDSLGPYVGPVFAFIFAEGVLIVGVVALETPVGAILYNHLPYQRENKVLEILMQVDVEVLPQTPGEARDAALPT